MLEDNGASSLGIPPSGEYLSRVKVCGDARTIVVNLNDELTKEAPAIGHQRPACPEVEQDRQSSCLFLAASYHSDLQPSLPVGVSTMALGGTACMGMDSANSQRRGKVDINVYFSCFYKNGGHEYTVCASSDFGIDP